MMRTAESEAYRLRAGLAVHRRRVEAAREAVRAALAAVPGAWAVSCSGGKDSTVLAHLAHAAGWRGPLFHWHSDEDPPENTALVHLLADRLGVTVIDAAVEEDSAIFDAIGHFVGIPETQEEARAVSRGRRLYKARREAIADGAGLVGLFWGLRARESRARAIAIARHGTLYRARDRRQWTCHPLARWEGADVWAYLVAHELPWLGVYDLSEDRERERSEMTWLGYPELWRRGQGRRLRERDPALWARLCARYPGLARYG